MRIRGPTNKDQAQVHVFFRAFLRLLRSPDTAPMSTDFKGFSPGFFKFFRELAQNNERAWFEENKPRYKADVLEPLRDFVEAMGPRLQKVSRHFIADPRANGGSIFRIYRDIRFSHDKRPYKEHAACQFRHRLGRDAHSPTFYVHLAPGSVFFGYRNRHHR